MTKIRLLAMVTLAAVLASCNAENRLYEDFHNVPQSNWGMQDSLTFVIGELAGSPSANLIAVKFNEEYEFSNCYLRVISKDSTGSMLDNKLVNMHLFNPKSGEPLGDGFGSTYTRYDTLPFLFPENTHTVTLLQYMRQDNLVGIEALGIKIIK